MIRFVSLFLFSMSAYVSSADSATNQFTVDNTVIAYQTEVIADGLNYPWAVAQLTSDRYLITERNGGLRLVENGKVSQAFTGLPQIYAKSQGGLLDLLLDRQYNDNGIVYLTLSSGNADANATQLIKAQLDLERLALTSVTTIFTVAPTKDTPVHYGGRVIQLPDSSLLLSTGDGFDYREQAQQLDNQLGKMIRLSPNGKPASDNPFAESSSGRAAVYSYGHRNPQGLFYDPIREIIWAHEHGPKGGDEINIIKPGVNYGWPVATFGKDYSGANISPFTEYPGMEQPVFQWTPSIAPSGLAVYYGDVFPEINGQLLVGTLVDKDVKLVRFADNMKGSQTSLFAELNARIRDVRVGIDGSILLLTDDGDGKLVKVTRVMRQPTAE